MYKTISNVLELRIDNLVLNKHKEVHRFTHMDFLNFRHPNMGGDYGFYSIPLDDQWLHKLGFELKSEYEFKHFRLNNGFWISMWCKDEPCAGFEEKGVCYWGEDLLSIRFVHQLQNLYHVITGGKELEVVNEN